MLGVNATRAYRARSADRNFKHQEADVIRRATAALKVAQAGSELEKMRAISDNRMLWGTIVNCLRDPDNRLPDALKSSIISVGLAIQRELGSDKPDFKFVININEYITAGLMGE